MKFILFFHGKSKQPKPNEYKKFTRQWGEWFEMLSEKGIFESILPRNQGGKKVTGRSVERYLSIDEDYAGYLINVKSEREAIEIAQKAPYISFGGSIIVKPCVDLEI